MKKQFKNDLGLSFVPNGNPSLMEHTLHLYPFTICLLLEAPHFGIKETDLLNALEIITPIDRRAVAKAFSFYQSNPDSQLERFQHMTKVALAVKNSFLPQPLILDNIFESVSTRIGFLFVPESKDPGKAGILSRPDWAKDELDSIWQKPPTGVIGWIHTTSDILMLQIVDHNRQMGEAIRILSQNQLKEQAHGYLHYLMNNRNLRNNNEKGNSRSI